MTPPDSWRFEAKRVVASWPPLTERDNAQLSSIAVARQKRLVREKPKLSTAA